jgi:hypothetical protein
LLPFCHPTVPTSARPPSPAVSTDCPARPARIERDLRVTADTLALFVRFWLTIAPPLPSDAQAAAQIKGRERYEGFVETLGKRLQKGQNFLREIPDDVDPTRGDLSSLRDMSSADLPLTARAFRPLAFQYSQATRSESAGRAAIAGLPSRSSPRRVP